MPSRQSLFFLSLLLVLFGASVLLFYGGPGAYAARSVKELWNLGHVLYFLLLIMLVSKILKNRGFSTGWIWILSLLLTFLWGAAIEMIQQGGDRNAEIMDFLRDLSGALLALVFIPGSIEIFHRKLRNFIRYVVIGFFIIILVPLIVAVSDETIAAAQFPVLSNFETPFELDRWNGSAKFDVVESVEASGVPAMRIALSTKQVYPGIGLIYLESDWSGYEFLNLDIFYPRTSPLKLTVKVFDAVHRSVEPAYLYHDRFNRPYQIKKGWNHIRVSLQDIRTSPKNREMDMTKIAGLQLFGVRLKQPETIYLDRLYLSD